MCLRFSKTPRLTTVTRPATARPKTEYLRQSLNLFRSAGHTKMPRDCACIVLSVPRAANQKGGDPPSLPIPHSSTAPPPPRSHIQQRMPPPEPRQTTKNADPQPPHTTLLHCPLCGAGQSFEHVLHRRCRTALHRASPSRTLAHPLTPLHTPFAPLQSPPRLCTPLPTPFTLRLNSFCAPPTAHQETLPPNRQ